MKNKTGLSEKLISQMFAVVKKISEITNVKLLGSRARGTQREYSDVDLAIFGAFDC
ncbi:MAG: nucleotidyltransferase domain-containing protein [Streptococcaceae bacterium]|jgi:predicted nucleotidyltransferase|nr:nucleotidyltransferase domain-containing protein [Streptococcaceae bacterium]